jgi:hypothetical protein
MDDRLDKLGEIVAGALPGSVIGYRVANGELTVDAVASDIVKVATFLRDDERCQFWSIGVQRLLHGAPRHPVEVALDPLVNRDDICSADSVYP